MSSRKITNNLIGAGGSKKPKEPVVTPDNLFSEDIVEFSLAISEGPIRGLARGAKSFYVGTTPLVSETGSLNYTKFAVTVHPGYPDNLVSPVQYVLGGETSNLTVGVPLNTGVSVIRQSSSILRNTIDQLEVRIKFDRLLTSNQEGTFNGTVQFRLEYKRTSSSTWLPFYANPVLTITGKTSDGYTKDYKVNVPRIDEDWQIRVIKLTGESTDQNFADITFESIQFTSKGLKAYPNTAVLHGVGVATGQFTSIPDFSGIYDGILCRVPTNYNGDTREYDEFLPWDGSFKFAWTNNPVWILYDLIMNPRYGMVKHLPQVDINRFDCYNAAKWCDTMVEVVNGDTSTFRPRYTFNGVIAEPRPAMELLNYVAASFNALVWDDLSGQIHLKVDKDDIALQIFSAENITEEGFTYTFTDITTRVNDISVSFINPDLDYSEDRRRIPGVTTNEAAILEFGRIPEDFIAVGCTNADEAICKATYRLISAQTEKTSVSFTTVRMGALLSLFDVILIADPTMGWSQSGRLVAYTDQYMFVRDPIFIETLTPLLMKLQTAFGIVEMTVMPEAVGMQTRLILGEKFPEFVPENTVFTLEQAGGLGFAKPFRVMSINEIEGSPYAFRITAMELNRNKYIQSELGQYADVIQYSFKTPTLPAVPYNVLAQSGDDHLLYTAGGQVLTRIYVQFTKPPSTLVSSYEVDWRNYDEYDWHTTSFDQDHGYLFPIQNGHVYIIRVRSIDTKGNKSSWSDEITHQAVGKVKEPQGLNSFSATGGLFEISLRWSYSTEQDIRCVEIYYNTSDNLNTATLLTQVPYPALSWNHLSVNMGDRLYYWARVQDTSGNYSVFTSSVNAAPSTNPQPYLDILEGSITESALSQALAEKIDSPDSGTQLLIEEVIDRVNGQIYTKIDNHGYVTGYGLSSTLSNGVPTSEFIIRADKFAIVRPGTGPLGEDEGATVPFAVGLVNGQSVVGVNGQLIIDGSITATALTVDKLSSLSSDIGEATAGSFNINNKFIVDRLGNMTALSGIFGGQLLAGVIDFSQMEGITHTFSQPGTYTVVVPSGKTTMRISACGGAGGGGSSNYAGPSGWISDGGGGGGASNMVVTTVDNVQAGTVLTIVVGAAGAAGNYISNGGDGGNSTVSGYANPIVAYGGKGGGFGRRSRQGAYSDGTSAGGAGGNGAPAGGAGGASGYYTTGSGISQSTVYIHGAGGPGGKSTNGGADGGDGARGQGSPGAGGGWNGGAGQSGKVLVEFFNPNAVVLQRNYDILISALQRQGLRTA